MNIKQILLEKITFSLQKLYNLESFEPEVQQTRAGFAGDFTLVVFPLSKVLKKSPLEISETIGKDLQQRKIIESYKVIQGFLNLSLPDSFFLSNLECYYTKEEYGIHETKNESVMVEYSSPNTNKPIHLGHVRNILLGHSLAQIHKAAGKNVVKTQIINDRGIHICKSMLAWKKFGENETPEKAKLKGDHLVGKYYVRFSNEHKKQVEELIKSGVIQKEAEKSTPILLEAQTLLQKWETKDPETIALWKKMNTWVYDGFAVTYDRLGVSFDFNQYESNTYLLGKDLIEKGLKIDLFYQKDDGSIWCDLSEEGLDDKLLLRADGTSVYITQDIGTAQERFENYDIETLTYVVGNEQENHFKVLFLILKKLGFSWYKKMTHLSYGMVDLPDGKMKSREGTVVDADDLMNKIHQTAKEISIELGDRLANYTQEQKENLYEHIGLGALKYYILKVDPKKRILFNPKENIQFHGDTGPFIQYTHARIQSLIANQEIQLPDLSKISLSQAEKSILIHLEDFPSIILKASNENNPSVIANYLYDLVKLYNGFYQNYSVLNAKTEEIKSFRLALSQWTANVIKTNLNLLGIVAPNRM